MKSYEEIEAEAKQKLKTQKKDGTLDQEPDKHRFYERALEMQATTIENQKKELSKLNRIYQRDVSATKVGEAIGFLWAVLTKKFRK